MSGLSSRAGVLRVHWEGDRWRLGFARDGSPTVSIKMADKLGALRSLGQYLGMFKQDARINGEAPLPVVLSSVEAAP